MGGRREEGREEKGKKIGVRKERKMEKEEEGRKRWGGGGEGRRGGRGYFYTSAKCHDKSFTSPS